MHVHGNLTLNLKTSLDLTLIGQLTIDGNLDIADESILKTAIQNKIIIGGNLYLRDNAILTVKESTYENRVLNILDIEVANDVLIDATSKVDLSGKGYITYYAAPD